MASKKDTLKHTEGSINADGYGTIAKIPMCDRNVSIEAKAIYGYLCSYMGTGDTAFPSVKKICYDLKISKERFYRHLNDLVENNYIIIHHMRWNTENKKGQQANNNYELVTIR